MKALAGSSRTKNSSLQSQGKLLPGYVLLGISLLSIGAAQSQSDICDKKSINMAAREYGYQPVPGKSYCEGLLQEKQNSEMQVLFLMSKTLINETAAEIVISVPKIDTNGKYVLIQGASNLLGHTYRFDARVKPGESITLDLNRVVKNVNLLPEDLVFLGTVQDSLPTQLIPLIISGSQERHGTSPPTIIGIRVPAVSISSFTYSLLSVASKKAIIETGHGKRLPGNSILRLPLKPASPGLYTLELELMPSVPAIASFVMAREIMFP